MKYWILPTIKEWLGIISGLIFCWLIYSIIQVSSFDKNTQTSLIVGLAACAVAFMGMLGELGAQDRIRHHKKILQRAGLWTDEIIKKKDLLNNTNSKDPPEPDKSEN